MVGSIDSLDFCTEIPVTEKNVIPLDCWHDISLSNVWIPSHLLLNRSKPRNIRVPQGIYHTLEKKDSSKYAKSFSVYSFPDSEIEQEEIFVSDSDDDNFGSDSTSFEKIHTSDNTLPTVADHSCPQSNACSKDLGNSVKTNILNKNQEKDDQHVNPKKNLIVTGRASPYLDETYQIGKVRKISSDENLTNDQNLENDTNICVKSLSKSVNTESQVHFVVRGKDHEKERGSFEDRFVQTSSQINKKTDSVVSLKDILDGTSEKNIKDFAFEYKKGEDPTLLCSYDNKREKKIKKNKKDKGKKKTSNYLTLDSFLDTNTDVDASQDYYCDKYLQSLLNEKQKNTHVPVESNIEFPNLAFEGYKFIHSEKKRKENYIKSTNLRCDYDKSEEINENIFEVEEVKKCNIEQCNIASNIEFPDSAFEGYKSEEVNEDKNIVDVEEVKQYTTCGKLVIENIPPDVTRDDISVILCGYGDIKRFSLVSVGNFLTAYVEIDLTCDIDIDWIIECLNGSDPFGASTKAIRCYKE